MKKQFIALLAAVIMTSCVGASMLAISGVALFNSSGTKASDSQIQAAQISQTSGANNSNQTQIQQLQSLVVQYQSREQQYQSREGQYRQQLDQANAEVQQAQQQMQQIQSLLTALQQRGLITVTGDGRIYINN